jgi:hypothetical protein
LVERYNRLFGIAIVALTAQGEFSG